MGHDGTSVERKTRLKYHRVRFLDHHISPSSSYWSVSIFSGVEELYLDQYGIFRPTLRVPASKNIEGYDFYLGKPLPPGLLPSHVRTAGEVKCVTEF